MEHHNDIMQNEKLFQRVKYVYDQKAEINLTVEQMTLLEKTYKGFVRSGASRTTIIPSTAYVEIGRESKVINNKFFIRID